MGKYAERSCELFKSGANCAQSVYAAFAEVLGLEEDFCLKAASPFGGGMGRMREVCGAFSGLLMVVGSLCGYSTPDDQKKRALYQLVQSLGERFKEENGSLICKELLGLSGKSSPIPSKRTESYYAKRPCLKMVESAALMAEEFLKK